MFHLSKGSVIISLLWLTLDATRIARAINETNTIGTNVTEANVTQPNVIEANVTKVNVTEVTNDNGRSAKLMFAHVVSITRCVQWFSVLLGTSYGCQIERENKPKVIHFLCHL